MGASWALRTVVVILKETPRNLPKVPIPLFIMSVILGHEFHRLRKQVVSNLAVHGFYQWKHRLRVRSLHIGSRLTRHSFVNFVQSHFQVECYRIVEVVWYGAIHNHDDRAISKRIAAFVRREHIRAGVDPTASRPTALSVP